MSSKQPAPDVIEIEQAKRNAAVAKARVQSTAGALKQRLHPRTLAADAADTVKVKTGAIGEQARRRPGAAAAVAGAATLIVLRKPLVKLARRLFSRTAKDERRARKEAARLDKAERRIAKQRRREAKRGQRNGRAAAERAPENQAAPPTDLIPHAAAVETGAAAAKQE